MTTISLRFILAGHSNSLDRLRRDLGVARPTSARALVRAARGGRFCDFPDPPNGIGLRTSAYTLKDKRRRSTLAWTVSGALPGVVDLPTAIGNAFGVWQRAIPALNFPRSLSGGGDVNLTVRPLAPNILGSTSPDGTQIQFTTATTWASRNPAPPGTTSLLAVAIHEIGHAIGLLHATSDGSIMNPFNANIEVLTPDDINGARALYGWEGQRPLPERATDRGPALCACGPILAMAWKGIGDDHRIFYATSLDGLSWSSQQVVEGVGTSDSPSLAWDGTRLWMAWKGVPGDSSLLFATTNDPTSWPSNPGRVIIGVGSSDGPSIAMTPGPILVWKGIEGDSGIFFSTFNPASIPPPWQPQQKIGGVGTSDRPALISDVTGQPLMVWKGIEGDSNLFASTQTGIFWQPQQPVSWIVPGNVAGGTIGVDFPGTAFGPGIATDGSRVFVVWRGEGDDQGIWFTQRAQDIVGGQNVIEWSSQGNIPNVGTSHRPAAAFFGGRLHLAWKGIGDDHNIFMSRL